MSGFKSNFKIHNLFSLRVLMVVLIPFITFISVAGIKHVITYNYQAESMRNHIVEVKGEFNILIDDMVSLSYFSNLDSELINAELEQLEYDYSARVVLIDDAYTIIRDNYLLDEGKTDLTSGVISAMSQKGSSLFDCKEGTAEIYLPVVDSDGSVSGVLNISTVNVNLIDTMEYVEKVAKAVEFGIIAVSLAIGVILSFSLSAPAGKMRKNIVRITNGDKEARVTATSMYEYRVISDAVNGMLDKLDKIEKSREEFVSNVSHELKTPMTSMKVLADSLLSQESAPEELYRDFMQDIVNEIDRENKIISDLLDLVKTDQTGVKLNIDTVSINEVAERVLKRLHPIAAERNVDLIMENVRPVAAQIDEVKFTQVITNLVENAIKYNVENGWVRVSINADHKYFYVNVADSGIGIPMESRDKIFERFYRVDKARSRESGGTGLGLSITKNIVLMHKGTIKLYSKENEGTTFTVRIPLNYVGGNV